MPYPAGVVKGVEDQANAGAPHFFLRLTCVIDGDHCLKATAGQRPSSATSFAITRRVDASDRYFRQVVAAHSEFNTTGEPVVVRDDTDEASVRRPRGDLRAKLVRSLARRPFRGSAMPTGSGTRSDPFRGVTSRCGRMLERQTEEGEVFPAVVAVAWDFESRQHTTLQLSDHRGER